MWYTATIIRLKKNVIATPGWYWSLLFIITFWMNDENMFGKKSATAGILCRHWSGLEVYLSNHRNVLQSFQNWSKLHSSRIVIVTIILATCSCQLVHLPYATFEEYTRQNRSLWSLSSGSFKLVCVVTQSTHYYSLAYHWKHASPFAPLSNSKWNPTPKPL